MKISNSILIFTFLMFLCITQAYGQKLTEKETCDQTLEIQVSNVNATKAVRKNKWCLTITSIVYDCLMYTSDGDCKTCPPDSAPLEYDTIFGMKEKGCVPFAQRTILCGVYERLCVLDYKCIQCQQIWGVIVPIVGGADNIQTACVSFEVPLCQQYAMIDGFPSCNKCKDGYAQFTRPFYYLDFKGRGKACLDLDMPYSTDCQMQVTSNGYYFCRPSCSDPLQKRILFNRGGSCINQPTETLPPCSMYKKYEEDLTKLQCLVCPSTPVPYDFVQNVQVGLDTYAKICVAISVPKDGCTQFVKTSNGVLCKSCDSHHDFLPFDSTKYPPPDYDTSIILGQCVLKSRFDLDLRPIKCLYYTFAPENWLFVCEKCAAQGEVSPCAQPKGSCRNGLAQVKIYKNEEISSKCVNNRIDFCQIYEQQVSTISCLKCRDGYELVVSLQHKFDQVYNKICIEKSYVIPDCYIYHSLELTCLMYYNPACPKPESKIILFTLKPSPCLKIVVVGYTHVCVACPLGYTLKNNSCLKSVQHCENLFPNGYCLSCVQPHKYQLINNGKCVQRPKFCKLVKIDGSCELCEEGYHLNKIGNCTVSHPKTCPSYQYLNSQNECVPGSISNCLTYQTYGFSCLKCKPNYILSSDFKQCTPANKWVDLPPCPSDNKEFRYERNDRGECIAIDTQCLNFIKQNGYCYECSENSYAYQGLCYNFEFLGQGN